MTTPDDYLGPRVMGELTLDDGQVVELTARPHKEHGLTDRTFVGIRPVQHRFGAHIKAHALKVFAGLGEPEVQGLYEGAVFDLGEVSLTQDDAKAVLGWLADRNGELAR